MSTVRLLAETSPPPSKIRKAVQFTQDWITGPAFDFFSAYSIIYMSIATGWVLPVSPAVGAVMTVASSYANSRFLMPLIGKMTRPLGPIKAKDIAHGGMGTLFAASLGTVVVASGGEPIINFIRNKNMMTAAAGFLIAAGGEQLSRFCFWKPKETSSNENPLPRLDDTDSPKVVNDVKLNL